MHSRVGQKKYASLILIQWMNAYMILKKNLCLNPVKFYWSTAIINFYCDSCAIFPCDRYDRVTD